jgi:sugar-phosphatase
LPDPPLLVTGDDVSSGKPQPAPYLLAASRLGVRPEQCVVVEDARAGVEAGKRAGMQVVAVAVTYTVEDLSGAGADVVIERLTHMRVRAAAGNHRLALVFR